MLPRVGLFGGSFNPPHVCHVLACQYVLATTDLDAVWWLPVDRHAFAKDAELRPFAQRLALCEAAVEGDARLRVHAIEAELEPPSRTIDVVEALRTRHPGVAFSWILGSDLLAELPSWHRWPELRDQLEFVVVGRAGSEATPPEGRFLHRPLTLPDVASSALRRDLAAGLDVADRVPRGVLELLRREGWYG